MRIIAGSARGCQIQTIEGLNTRPTLDRVREAIFGSIQFALQDAVVLDLFSGSGAMGLEAASRGASMAYLNDASRECCNIIRTNIVKCSLEGKVSLSNLDYQMAISSLRDKGIRFDFVFLDAPYASGFSITAAEMIAENGMLAKGGRIFWEHHSDETVPGVIAGGRLTEKRTRRYGKCSVTELIEADS